jgi:hypothetical protein
VRDRRDRNRLPSPPRIEKPSPRRVAIPRLKPGADRESLSEADWAHSPAFAVQTNCAPPNGLCRVGEAATDAVRCVPTRFIRSSSGLGSVLPRRVSSYGVASGSQVCFRGVLWDHRTWRRRFSQRVTTPGTILRCPGHALIPRVPLGKHGRTGVLIRQGLAIHGERQPTRGPGGFATANPYTWLGTRRQLPGRGAGAGSRQQTPPCGCWVFGFGFSRYLRGRNALRSAGCLVGKPLRARGGMPWWQVLSRELRLPAGCPANWNFVPEEYSPIQGAFRYNRSSRAGRGGEMADAADSKSAGATREGSNPSPGTEH